MTFYDQLKKHLTTKQYVLIQRGNGQYCTFSHNKDPKGNYRISSWWNGKEIAMSRIGYYNGYTTTIINEWAEKEDWQILKAFDVPQKRFKVGDIVLVDENAQELCEQVGILWHHDNDSMLGQECEIKYVFNYTYYVYTPDGSVYFAFPHSALSYPIKPRTITLTLEEAKQKLAEMSSVSVEQINITN